MSHYLPKHLQRHTYSSFLSHADHFSILQKSSVLSFIDVKDNKEQNYRQKDDLFSAGTVCENSRAFLFFDSSVCFTLI